MNKHKVLIYYTYIGFVMSEENNIQVSEVLLRVLWSDANQHRNIELSTLKLNGILYSSEDSFLVKSFSGGVGSIKQEEESPKNQGDTTSKSSQNISGSITSMNGHISGASNTHVSGN